MNTTLLVLAGALGALVLALAADPGGFKHAARVARALEVQNEG